MTKTHDVEDELRQQLAAAKAEISVYQRLLSEALEREREAALKLAMQGQAQPTVTQQTGQPNATLVNLLTEMTLKQRATLFATLKGHSYAQIADAMRVDDTTVKLHLKRVLERAGLPNRNALLITAKETLAELNKIDVEDVFEIPLDWIETQKHEVMEKLKPARPQTSRR